MSIFNKKKILVTHNGSFHADDLFAAAVISIINKGDLKIIRTRDPQIITTADYVCDVGGKYEPENNLFDHHQRGGAGQRENGILYSSFGLVWKKYGEEICGDKEVAERIERKIVCPIDAIDNGIDFAKSLYDGIIPYGPDQVFLNNTPTWKEGNKNIDTVFVEQVKKIVEFLQREVLVTKTDVEGDEIIKKAYLDSSDKRIIVLENDFPRYLYQNTLSGYKEPIYAVFPSGHSDMWKVEAIRKDQSTMENRKLFPESWRGYFNGEEKFKEVTGVEEALFCHKGGFLAIASSKDGAIKLAEKALNSN